MSAMPVKTPEDVEAAAKAETELRARIDRYGEKLRKVLENDLCTWMKEVCEDKTVPVDVKIRLGGPFGNAVLQIRTCLELLK